MFKLASDSQDFGRGLFDSKMVLFLIKRCHTLHPERSGHPEQVRQLHRPPFLLWTETLKTLSLLTPEGPVVLLQQRVTLSPWK